MLFISTIEIDRLKQETTDPLKLRVIGMPLWYYFLTDNGNGVCGMPVKVIGMRQGPEGNDGPFFIDIAVETPVPDFFSLHNNLSVRSLTLEERDGSGKEINEPTVCPYDEVDKIMEIINAPRYSDGLKVVVDNTKQKD